MFNPVLAFSVQFPCSGHTYLEYCFVYWLGPALGKQRRKKHLLFQSMKPEQSVGIFFLEWLSDKSQLTLVLLHRGRLSFIAYFSAENTFHFELT